MRVVSACFPSVGVVNTLTVLRNRICKWLLSLADTSYAYSNLNRRHDITRHLFTFLVDGLTKPCQEAFFAPDKHKHSVEICVSLTNTWGVRRRFSDIIITIISIKQITAGIENVGYGESIDISLCVGELRSPHSPLLHLWIQLFSRNLFFVSSANKTSASKTSIQSMYPESSSSPFVISLYSSLITYGKKIFKQDKTSQFTLFQMSIAFILPIVRQVKS